MTSANGNIFRVTGHICGEFTGDRWIPRTKASDAELWSFRWSASMNGWVNNREAGELRCHRAHFAVTVMMWVNGEPQSHMQYSTWHWHTGRAFVLWWFGVDQFYLSPSGTGIIAWLLRNVEGKLFIWACFQLHAKICIFAGMFVWGFVCVYVCLCVRMEDHT